MADGYSGNGGEDGGGHVPTREIWPLVPHYYGDFVRQLMLGGAALMLFGAPFYGDSLRTELPFEVFGALVLVSLAAVINPRNKSVLTATAIATGVGMAVYQTWALYGYEQITPVAFVLREALAILFMFAFYFSVKTVRAMILHQIGKRDSVDEFKEELEKWESDDEDDKENNSKPRFSDKAGD